MSTLRRAVSGGAGVARKKGGLVEQVGWENREVGEQVERESRWSGLGGGVEE